MKKKHKNSTTRVWLEEEERDSDRNKTMNEAKEGEDMAEGISMMTLTQDTEDIDSKEPESDNTKETPNEKESKKDTTDSKEGESKTAKGNRGNEESNKDTPKDTYTSLRKMRHDIIANL